MTFTEHPVFTKRISELLSDEEYREFQTDLAANPQTGDVIPGLGGLRKIRLALPGRGKRGGARVLYLLFLNAETVFLLYVFTKGEFGDLPPDKKRVIKALVEEIKKEFK
ncbi:MAG: type II toxin-antitoxin system RelE/ParE family toxin [Kiritimatiellia bacterium]|nr:type II toxin-antitoxin system RelE/ParE family toxin [Kiritimatiellia bacterium]MDP6810799.1 type II toxin-antitoxin system RelE/ParE family toxin [Kiritimatiellia bacterium]MDP7024141.1 type II toxin-antitoxin system RelE/ParE family toxin [Kiritimatiellia bacterium]